MGEDSGEKTEDPTPTKLRDARKKGQIAKSKDLTAAILLMTAFFSLRATAKMIWEQLSAIMIETSYYIPNEVTFEFAGYILRQVLITFLTCVAPMFGIVFMVAIIVEVAQTGFVASLDPIKPSFNKLNPIEGVKKFFSLKQYIELLKSVAKMIIIVSLIYSVLKDEILIVVISQSMELYQVVAFVGDLVMKVIVRVGVAYLVIAFLDYLYQKYEYIKGLKMSKKEIKDEYKRLEGDPMIKQRQREIARQMSQGRQMGSVPDSDVVVTNPIHIAIAITYVPNKMRAPKVVAMGKRLIADEIRKVAVDNNVPIVENPPLARALYDLVEVGMDVPEEYYRAVAEILAFVYNLKQKRIRR